MAARRRAGRSWVWTLGLLALITVPGFGLGLVAGVAWEDPSLLGSHLLGGTTEVVVWSDDASGIPTRSAGSGSLPDVAAPAAPRSSEPVRPVAAPRPARETAPPAPVASPAKRPDATRIRPEVLSPGADSGRFAVQVGAFGESASAERLAARLRGKGFEVYVSPGVAAGQARWRVRVGPSPTRDVAERAAARLKAEEQLPTWVLDENGPQ
jgi:cell division septation protein DedD